MQLKRKQVRTYLRCIHMSLNQFYFNPLSSFITHLIDIDVTMTSFESKTKGGPQENVRYYKPPSDCCVL